MEKQYQSRGKSIEDSYSSTVTEAKDSIALLGTSADPPTFGHKNLIEGLLTLFPKVIIWASNNPLKNHTVSLEIRHNLLKVLVKEINHPNLELIQELSSPLTINTLEHASKRWPNKILIFVIGSDLTQQIPNWSQAKRIVKKAQIGIVPRKGWPVDQQQLEDLELLGGKINLLPLKIPYASSTNFRDKKQSDIIPSSILEILHEKNLYGFKRKYE